MPVSLLQPLREVPIAVVDVETTGASTDYGHRVIELGIVRLEAGVRVAEYQQLLDPQRRVAAGITALTGISQAMVDGQPTFADQIQPITQLLRGAVVMGHNVRFDLSFIAGEYRRAGRDISTELGPAVHVLDTVRLARRMFGRGGNGLQRLSRRLGIEPVTAHRALADAQTTHLVFEQMITPVGGWSLTLLDAIRHQGGPMGLAPVSPRESPLPLELQEALEQKKPVLMIYLDARQTRTERVIVPLELRRAGGDLILIAHCHLRDDRRTFKLERIVELRRIDGESPPMDVSPANAEEPCGPADDQPSSPEPVEVATAKSSVESITPQCFVDALAPAGDYRVDDAKLEFSDSKMVILSATLRGPAGSQVWARGWLWNDTERTLAESASPQLIAGDRVTLTVRLTDDRIPDYASLRIESAPLQTEHVLSIRLPQLR